MLNKLIKEIETALDNNLYLVALNTALTLPDICGKAEYTYKGNKQRYICWYDDHVKKSIDNIEQKMPELNGDVIYSLRCSLLHQGNPNIEKDGNKKNIDDFVLKLYKDTGIYIDMRAIVTHANNTTTRKYIVDVRGLCYILCQSAKQYYDNNKIKFNFFNYKTVDYNLLENYLKIKNNK